MNNKTSNTKGQNSSLGTISKSKDKTLSTLINYGTVIAFFGIAILIYLSFFRTKKTNGFENSTTTTTIAETTVTTATTTNNTNNNTNNNTTGNDNGQSTIYDTALKTIFDGNDRMICNILATPTNNICVINDETYIKYNFPVHMIKLIDGTILAVFNDGRLYQKDNILNTMWKGPLQNSLPNDTIPLRMITLGTDLNTLLGIGYDNQLYIKRPNIDKTINLTTSWAKVPNCSNMIYVLFDNESGKLIGIDTNGKLWIKSTTDITSDFTELMTKLDRPVLRLYYDMNGYMLAIDNKFDMYQFSELNWKQSKLQLQRGANSSKIQDILYDNDGRLYGLVFNRMGFILQIMKQDMAFYLGNFLPLDQHVRTSDKKDFIMSDQDIIKSKIGNIDNYLKALSETDTNDEDPNVAYQKMILETRADLKQFCSNRNATSTVNYDNYELLSKVEDNDVAITRLKGIIGNLIKYEPDKERLTEKYPIITK